MKFILSVLLLACAAMVYADDDWRPCTSDYQCDHDDCCIEDRFSRDGSRVCRDMGDDPGERCGGRYFCGCERGFNCVPHQGQITDWYSGSNGTCQYDQRYLQARRGSYAPSRRYYVPDFDDLDDLFDDDDDDHDFDDDRRRRRRR